MVCLPVPPLPHSVNYFCSQQLSDIGVRGFHTTAPDFAPGLLHPTRPRLLPLLFSGRSEVPEPRKQFLDRLFAGMHITHRGLNVIVSGYVLQRERIRVLTGLGQEGCFRIIRLGEHIITP